MRLIVAAVLSVGMCVADDKATPPFSEPSAVAPEQDVRLAKLAGAQPQKVGILTYYPNEGGGYTFKEGNRLAFYALPYLPTRHHFLRTRLVTETRNGIINETLVAENVEAFIVGKSKIPFGSQTIYLGVMTAPGFSGLDGAVVPIAKWTRDTPGGKFRLSIIAEDNETRVKLKSIIPVLEHAEHVR
jgi:hypothetical protein